MKQGRPRLAITRRHMLLGSGAVFAAAAVPTPSLGAPAPASPQVSPVMARLSSYMAEAGGKPLPDAVAEKAKPRFHASMMFITRSFGRQSL